MWNTLLIWIKYTHNLWHPLSPFEAPLGYLCTSFFRHWRWDSCVVCQHHVRRGIWRTIWTALLRTKEQTKRLWTVVSLLLQTCPVKGFGSTKKYSLIRLSPKNSLPVKRRSTLNLASWRYLLMYHITNTLSPVLCAHLLISWPVWFGTFWCLEGQTLWKRGQILSGLGGVWSIAVSLGQPPLIRGQGLSYVWPTNFPTFLQL